MSDETYSIKEMISEFRKDMSSELSEIKSEVKELGNKVGIQNGRVTKQELWSKEAQKIIESTQTKSDSSKDKIAWIMGVGAAVMILGTVIYGFAIKFANDKIDAKFIECCQKKTENASNINNTVNIK